MTSTPEQPGTHQLNDPYVVKGWVLYDWANSVYFLVIATAIFPIYYTAITNDTVSLFGTDITNSSLYAYTVSIAHILLVVTVPVFSGIADYGGRRKAFLKLFTWLGGLSCIGLFFFSSADLVWYGTGLFALATLGAGACIAFYNAYLPEIVTPDKYDSVSAQGYAYGYFGSVLLLVFCLVMINKPEWFGFTGEVLPTRLSFMLVGLWWLGFAQITFARLPDDSRNTATGLITKGIKELQGVWQKLRKQTDARLFLLAFLFYMGGVQTVIYLSTIFASVELKMETSELILVVLILQIVAIVGAYLFARVSAFLGNKISLLIQVGIWCIICVGAYFTHEKTGFYIVATLVGLVLGGIQSLSRATYAKLIDSSKEDLTSYFGFYDVMMKVSIVGGAFIFGLVEQITGGMRNSVLALMILFIIGGAILAMVRFDRKAPNSTDTL